MKKILAIAAAMAPLLAASPALAATTATYGVTGTVTAICSAASTGTVDFGTGGLANATTGVLTTTNQSAPTDSTAMCNGVNTTLAVAHTVMQAAGSTTASGFTNIIDFMPRVTLNTTAYSSTTATIVGAFSGLTVAATSLTTGGARPIAGTYLNGSITLTLTAAP